MMEKNVYSIPEADIVFFEDADIIETSGTTEPDDDGYSQYYPDPF